MDTPTPMAPLLVELLVEELPPKALKRLGEAFADGLRGALAAQGLCATDVAMSPFASPRRLAVRIENVALKAADRAQATKLMPVAVGLDTAGAPTAALLKKLASLGVGPEVLPRLARTGEGKAETLVFNSTLAGVSLLAGLQAALAEALTRLPIPKLMRYQLADGWTSVDFVRPAHGLVALHGNEVVAVTALGLVAGRTTAGHRFEARSAQIEIPAAGAYETVLADQGAVIAGFGERRREIERQLLAGAASAGVGLKPIADEALLDEVTALVERPNVLVCRFEREFLAVPPECLILTMKANQKYFPLLDADGRLTEAFLVVSNVRPADPVHVIQGNERVVRPRLADAKFFFDQDRKKRLEDRVAGLARVVYHGKLGSQGERMERVVAIAGAIGQQLGGEVLAAQARQAARLAKADLQTDMVGEFPELQGIMGAYYARHDGLPEAIADAIEDHYKPRFAGDVLPRGAVGVVVALADKLETLAGLFGIGQLPTGDKDPFALRRHALGALRLLIERALPLSLPAIVATAFAAFNEVPAVAPARADDLLGFVYDRLVGLLREQGYSAQEVDAVIALRPAWGEIPQRLAAVRSFAALPEAPALAAANKRVGNILKKAAEGEAAGAVDAALLNEPAERTLVAALADVAPGADAAFERGDHTASLQALAALKAPVDAFFDAVMVNADDAALRRNRLALLASLHRAMNRVADLSRLAA
jgi:glycyl-tRNA synthetase beta chain